MRPSRPLALLAALVLLVLGAPAAEHHPLAASLLRLLPVPVLMASVYSFGVELGYRSRRIVLLGSVLIGVHCFHMVHRDRVSLLLLAAMGSLFHLGASIGLMKYAVRARRINEDSLAAAITAYMLLVVAFGAAYFGVEVWNPGSFQSTPPWSETDHAISRLLYLSAMTMTTVGYGDVVPASNLTRALCGLEAMVGVLYPAILIARLVTLYERSEATAAQAPSQGD